MTEIGQVGNPLLQELAFKKADKENELDKNAFLRLMVTQLNNQDPLNPQENGDFIAQLAQFSSVEGIENLNNSFSSFASSMQSSQALQASALVGRSVHVKSDTSYLAENDVITGTIKLESSTSNLVLNVSNRAGELVDQIELGTQPQGNIKFVWNGINQDGIRLNPGQYKFEAAAIVGGESQQMNLALSANVDSVSIRADRSVVLNLAGIGPVPLLDVEEIL
ncbi:MAG: flagellar hook assembly protein FlgD [Pseudomonadales bacterium]|nr:flagellar hook assembly protein FlgD [Pseudomonadales bacterium]